MRNFCCLLTAMFMLGLPSYAQAKGFILLNIQLIAADQNKPKSSRTIPQNLPPRMLPKLRRLPYEGFQNNQFQQKGNKSVLLTVGQQKTVTLSGHTMKLLLENVSGKRARIRINWIRNNSSVIDITATTQPGSPFVCGGPRERNITWVAVFSVQ